MKGNGAEPSLPSSPKRQRRQSATQDNDERGTTTANYTTTTKMTTTGPTPPQRAASPSKTAFSAHPTTTTTTPLKQQPPHPPTSTAAASAAAAHAQSAHDALVAHHPGNATVRPVKGSPYWYPYVTGFGNEFATEHPSWKGSLPQGQNTPSHVPFGLYAEQLSGSAFTAPRGLNRRTWLYRIRPSVCHTPFQPVPRHAHGPLVRSFDSEDECVSTPNQLRWSPLDVTTAVAVDGGAKSSSSSTTSSSSTGAPHDHSIPFHAGWHTMCGSGGPSSRSGLAIYVYVANEDMVNTAMSDADGELLIVPQQGSLDVFTELGKIHVAPNEIVVIPRGIKFQVRLPDGPVRGYILEVFSGSFTLPDLGPIGANGLANPRDFEYPVAAFDEDEHQRNRSFHLVHKYLSGWWQATQDHSPFDVVAWHGNYAPYKYDLSRFNAVNSVTYDHIDPSIFTVLTCKSTIPGTAVADFVVFPPRWAVAEGTFRPPYFHRNAMSEFMGLIKGSYEAKQGGFVPGGASLHSVMTAHGPDAATYAKANGAPCPATRVADGTMAFMFESYYMLTVTKWALNESRKVQDDYWTHWQGLQANFPNGETPTTSDQA